MSPLVSTPTSPARSGAVERWVARAESTQRAPLLACALSLVACGPTPAGSVVPARSRPAAPRIWDYHVRATAGARELRVEVELPPGVPEELGLDAFAHPFLSDLQLDGERGWLAIAPSGRHWIVPRCREHGCRLRYVYRLAEAARRIDRFAYAGYRAGVLLAPPSTFLLAPQDYTGNDIYRFRVELAPGESFVTGVWREATANAALAEASGAAGIGHALPGAGVGSARAVAAFGGRAASRSDAPTRARRSARPEAFSAPASVLFQAPYSAFGAFERERLDVGGATLALELAPGDAGSAGQPPASLGVSRDGLRAALRRAAAAVSSYYGRFPVPEATLILLPTAGDDIFGMQLGNGGAAIVLFIGAAVDDERLARDWVVTHELLHLGFPTLGRRHLWLAEGLATYQEPIARARAGLLDERGLWRALIDGMPNGLPNATDGGLDGSMRWGRTYWGGALFCLLLDIDVRARTNNRLSLDSAARAILQGGGDTSMRWSLEQTLATADAALDRPSFSELYAEHSAAPVSVDLDALFQRLGVQRDGDRVRFDETAELAHVRRAIGQARSAPAERPLLESPPRAHEPQAGLSAPGVP